MKKKSLSARKKIHKNLLQFLSNSRIKKVYSIFSNNLGKITENNNVAVAVSGGPDSLSL